MHISMLHFLAVKALKLSLETFDLLADEGLHFNEANDMHGSDLIYNVMLRLAEGANPVVKAVDKPEDKPLQKEKVIVLVQLIKQGLAVINGASANKPVVFELINLMRHLGMPLCVDVSEKLTQPVRKTGAGKKYRLRSTAALRLIR